MKVVHVGEYVKGGVATHLRDVLKYQRNSSEIHDLYLILSSYNSEKDFPLEKNKIISYSYRRGIFHILNSMLEIKRLIKRLNPDIIHVHSTFSGFMVRFPLLFQAKRPKIIYNPHGWAFNMDVSKVKKSIFAFVEKLLSLKTDKIINISDYEAQSAVKHNFLSRKLQTIYNGLEDKKCKGVLKEVSLSLNKEKINILFIGRFDKQKGLDLLISTFAKLNSIYSNLALYLIGDAVLKDIPIDVPSNVTNIGWVDNKYIDNYMQLFEAVIIPSRWEGFGLVAIEAMRNRKAIIASNRGALTELVSDGVNGYIFDLNDLSTLETILNNLDKSTLKDLGERGYIIFKEKFTSIRMNEQIIEMYKDTLI